MTVELDTLGERIYNAIKSYLTTAWTAAWDAGGQRLTNLGAPSSGADAARKTEVDAVATTASGAVAAAAAAQAAADAAQDSVDDLAPAVLPPGGLDGQVLAKASDDDFDAEWIAAPGGDVPSSRLISAGSGLTGGGSLAADRSLAVDFGTGATQVRPGNDATYTNARTPTAHKTTHENGGADEISVAGLSGLLGDPQRADTLVSSSGDKTIGALADGEMLVVSGSTVVTQAIPTGDITAVVAGSGLTGGANSGSATLSVDFGTGTNQVRRGDDAAHTNDRTASGLRTATTTVAISNATAPSAGQVLTATSSTAAAWSDPAGDITAVTAGTGLTGGGSSGSVSLAVAYGSTSGTAAQGNDSRLSDARTPSPHAASHATGQSDAIAPSDIGAVPTSRTVSAGTGLTGGGDLSANRSLAVSFGTSGSTACVGNDSRLSDDRTASGIRTATTLVAVSSATAPTAGQVLTATSGSAAAWSDPAGDITAVTAGTGLTGGGSSGSVSLAADFGTGSGKVAQGNDSRFTDDRTASGLRTASTVVVVSSATAPTAGQILAASSSTAAGWVDPPSGSGFTAAVNTWGATPSSANLRAAVTDETGTGALVFATSPALVTPDLGTPSAATLTNATGLPISTGVSGLGTGVATFLATPSSANLRSALTDETGSGAAVFATSPTLVTPVLGTPSSGTLTNCTGLPASGVSSGTFDIARVTNASAGQLLRINAAANAIEGFFPVVSVCTGLTVTTTPSAAFTGSLPVAGTYAIEVHALIKIASTTASRSLTMTFDVGTNFSSINISSWRHTSSPTYQNNDPITADGGSMVLTLGTTVRGSMHAVGAVTVSGAATITVNASMSAETFTLMAGSLMKVNRVS